MGFLQNIKDNLKRRKDKKEIKGNAEYITDGASKRSKKQEQFHKEDAKNLRNEIFKKLDNLYETIYQRNDIGNVQDKLNDIDSMKEILTRLEFGYDSVSLAAIQNFFDIQYKIVNHCANFQQVPELNAGISDMLDLISDLDYSTEAYRDFEYVKWLKDYTLKLQTYYQNLEKLDRERAATKKSVADMRRQGRKDQDITAYIQDQNKKINGIKVTVNANKAALETAQIGMREIRQRIESMGAFSDREELEEAINRVQEAHAENASLTDMFTRSNEKLNRDVTNVTDAQMGLNVQEKEKGNEARSQEEYDDMIA